MLVDAAPITVVPSGQFGGNDGSWSSFNISVGNPAQELRVLPSTEIPETWVVRPGGCTGTGDASNCTQIRGQAFDVGKSPGWISKGNYALTAESNLGLNANSDYGAYGFDTIGVGKSGGGNVSVDGQVIAGIDTKDFFLGNLGLSSRPIVFPSNTDPRPSFLTSLRSQNLIPSLSYGYTAGASYRGAAGSLTLGGYDASRLVPNDVPFSFAATSTRQLLVGLQAIYYSDATHQDSSLLSQGILTLVDSTVPHIWLPLTACQKFEDAFGIRYDPISNLYLVNDTVHSALLAQNASVKFQLSNTPVGGPHSVNITLPYASFDLENSSPVLKKSDGSQGTSRYFPLRRASNGDDSQFTLGRSFLQESFLIVDYERSNFSISQSVFGQGTPEHIIPIPSINNTGTDFTNTTSSQPPLTKSSSNSSHSLATGAIAGIAVVIILLTLSCIGAAVYYSRRRRHRRNSTERPSCPELHEANYSEFNEKKDPHVDVSEVLMTPSADEIDGRERFAASTGILELSAGSQRSELPSPEPVLRSELDSSEPGQLRPELSTSRSVRPTSVASSPNGRINRPGMVLREVPSPVNGFVSSGEPSPEIELPGSGLPPPEPIQAREGIPFRRPVYERANSSYSEATWQGDRGLGLRPAHHRIDSLDSEAWPERRPPMPMRRPSHHGRLASFESSETMETRLERGSGASTLFSSLAHPSPSLPPVDHEAARSAMSSPEIGSVHSELLSPKSFDSAFDESRETPSLD